MFYKSLVQFHMLFSKMQQQKNQSIKDNENSENVELHRFPGCRGVELDKFYWTCMQTQNMSGHPSVNISFNTLNKDISNDHKKPFNARPGQTIKQPIQYIRIFTCTFLFSSYKQCILLIIIGLYTSGKSVLNCSFKHILYIHMY